jgi:hypothetical protein
MQKLGYDDRRTKKILGLNWLRVLRRVTEENDRDDPHGAVVPAMKRAGHA